MKISQNFPKFPKIALKLLFLALPFLLLQCSKLKDDTNMSSQHLISKEQAQDFTLSTKKGTRSKDAVEIVNSTPINDSKGIPALYVINYNIGEKANWQIVSADNRLKALLAYGDTLGHFVLDEVDNTGASLWIEDVVFYVDSLRYNTTDNLPNIWGNIQECENCGGPGCGTSTAFTVGPLMRTRWGQSCGYNDYLATCANPGSGTCEGRVPTGCVATALTQIIAHTGYSATKTYNFSASAMPNIVYSTGEAPEIARLMADFGSAASMKYGCDGGSGATNTNALKAIQGYGYSKSERRSFSAASLYDNLQGYRPVYLSGCSGSACHAWVCDGMKGYEDGCSKTMTENHMNWGWNGYSNGWYSTGNFKPNNTSYNFGSKAEMIHNIYPILKR